MICTKMIRLLGNILIIGPNDSFTISSELGYGTKIGFILDISQESSQFDNQI